MGERGGGERNINMGVIHHISQGCVREKQKNGSCVILIRELWKGIEKSGNCLSSVIRQCFSFQNSR